jgi:3-oxoacyl-[acyl-carrier-protein] synthase II
MREPREVVITGLGVVSPIGIGGEEFWAALDQGQSGIVELPEFAGTQLPYRFGGTVKNFDGKDYVQPRKTLKVMSREIQQAYGAAVIAMQETNLPKGSVEPERIGVVLGSQLLDADLDDMREVYRHCQQDGRFCEELWGEHAMKDLFPLWMLKYLPNMAACHIGIANDARGPNNTIVQGGVSSLQAIIEATLVIQRGHADVMLSGGSGSLTTISRLPFRGWDHVSKWGGDPAGAMRPFDAQRSGVVFGEGSGIFVLESREHAERRGAKILARIAGFSSRYEPAHGSEPRRGIGVKNSILGALQAAGLKPSDIGHVNAHGAGTIADDQVEARGIHEALGEVPVTAPKSFFGDLGGGSGAVEMAASVLALSKGVVPRTLNYQQSDPQCPVNVIRDQSIPAEKRTAMVLSQSDTGQAVAILLAGA